MLMYCTTGITTTMHTDLNYMYTLYAWSMDIMLTGSLRIDEERGMKDPYCMANRQQ